MKEMTCNESAYRSIQTLRKKAKEHQKLLLSSDQVSENYKNTVSDLTLVTPNPSKQPPGVSANKKIDFLTRDRIKSCDALNEVDEKVFEWYEVRQRPKSPSADARPNRKLQDRPVSVSRMTKNGRIIDKCILQSFEEISTDNKLKGKVYSEMIKFFFFYLKKWRGESFKLNASLTASRFIFFLHLYD